MPAVFEPNLMLDKMPFGEAMRMTLMGAHERISAARAHEIGLITEVVPFEELRDRAIEIATIIAGQPAAAIQASLRTLWAARQIGADRMKSLGNVFLNLSISAETLHEGPGDVLRRTADQAPHPLTRRPRTCGSPPELGMLGGP